MSSFIKRYRHPTFRLITSAILLLFISAAIAQFGGFDITKTVQGIGNVTKGLAGISLKQEMEMGGSIALQIASQQGGILKDEAMTRRVATIGRALADYSSRPTLPWTFAVLDNEATNAIAAPGGYVFVTKGLVESCETDYQLAGVLAHEISHVARRHALKMISGERGMKGLMDLGGSFDSNVGMFDDVVGGAATKLLTKGLPKGDEYDADREGTMLVYEAGFPPASLRDYLAGLEKKKASKGAFSTHPSLEDRVDRLDGEIDKINR